MFLQATGKLIRAAALCVLLSIPALSGADEVLLRVSGAVDKPLELTRADLAAMPRD